MAVYSEYDEKGEYKVVECDRCNDQAEILYDDSPEQLCMKCLLEKHKEDFVNDFWNEIIEQFGKSWVEGYETVNVDEG